MAKTFAERMIGAAMLDVATYEEVEADVGATSQAAAVVGIVAVASAIGALHGGTGAIVAAVIGAFLSWLMWAGVTYLVGTRAFNGTATWGELLRTLGFAQAPGVLAVLGIVPILGGVVRFVVAIWLLVTGVIAIRQALDFDTGKAILTAVIAWVVMIVVGIVLGLFGAAVMGMGAMVR
jgi:hypothetical protein